MLDPRRRACHRNAVTENRKHVQQSPHCAHRMGRLRSRRYRILSALFRHVRPLDGAADRARARHAKHRLYEAYDFGGYPSVATRARFLIPTAMATTWSSKPASSRSAARAFVWRIGSPRKVLWRWEASTPEPGWCAIRSGRAASGRCHCPRTWWHQQPVDWVRAHGLAGSERVLGKERTAVVVTTRPRAKICPRSRPIYLPCFRANGSSSGATSHSV